MLKKLINKIWKSEGQEDMATPSLEKASFQLVYKKLLIGTLYVNNGIWKFTYSDQFKAQDEILPLVDFPNKKSTYESAQLWPFFSYRIPGLNQPSVQEIIRKESIDKENEVALLKKFGRFSIFNPYLLNPS